LPPVRQARPPWGFPLPAAARLGAVITARRPARNKGVKKLLKMLIASYLH